MINTPYYLPVHTTVTAELPYRLTVSNAILVPTTTKPAPSISFSSKNKFFPHNIRVVDACIPGNTASEKIQYICSEMNLNNDYRLLSLIYPNYLFRKIAYDLSDQHLQDAVVIYCTSGKSFNIEVDSSLCNTVVNLYLYTRFSNDIINIQRISSCKLENPKHFKLRIQQIPNRSKSTDIFFRTSVLITELVESRDFISPIDLLIDSLRSESSAPISHDSAIKMLKKEEYLDHSYTVRAEMFTFAGHYLYDPKKMHVMYDKGVRDKKRYTTTYLALNGTSADDIVIYDRTELPWIFYNLLSKYITVNSMISYNIVSSVLRDTYILAMLDLYNQSFSIDSHTVVSALYDYDLSSQYSQIHEKVSAFTSRHISPSFAARNDFIIRYGRSIESTSYRFAIQYQNTSTSISVICHHMIDYKSGILRLKGIRNFGGGFLLRIMSETVELRRKEVLHLPNASYTGFFCLPNRTSIDAFSLFLPDNNYNNDASYLYLGRGNELNNSSFSYNLHLMDPFNSTPLIGLFTRNVDLYTGFVCTLNLPIDSNGTNTLTEEEQDCRDLRIARALMPLSYFNTVR